MTSDISFEADSALYDFDGDGVMESNFIPVGGRQAAAVLNNYRLFQGIFDGDGHIVSGLRILYGDNVIDYVGLFGVAWGATIKNVGIENGEFSGSGCVGALCGQIQSNGRISGCFVRSCNISGKSLYVGGLCAANATGSVIESCYVDNSFVSGNDFVGGLCGLNNPYSVVSIIKNCYSAAEVETRNKSTYYGGFCGYSTNDTAIINCYAADGWQVTDSVESGLFSLRGNVRSEAFMFSTAFVDTLNKGLNMAAWRIHCNGSGAPSLLWECNVVANERTAAAQNSSLRVYPNPAFDKVTVEGATEKITVYDISGRAVISVDTDRSAKTINVGVLPAGYYIVKDKNCAVKMVKR
jgi:hypothetical protein